jgi:ankyrin repeat protein
MEFQTQTVAAPTGTTATATATTTDSGEKAAATAGSAASPSPSTAQQFADVDAKKLDGTTALFWAAHGGYDEVVLKLLSGGQGQRSQSGATVDLQDFVDGSQAIHFACHGQNGWSNNNNNNNKSSSASTTTTATATTGHGDNNNDGASRSTRRVLNHLLTFGADPGARSAVTGPRDPSHPSGFKQEPSREELVGGRTPLHVAAAEGNLEAIRLLLGLVGTTTTTNGGGGSGTSGHVDVDAVDVQGLSAVALAAMQGHPRALELLLTTGGARPDMPAMDARYCLMGCWRCWWWRRVSVLEMDKG